jgi:hypothetical protein
MSDEGEVSGRRVGDDGHEFRLIDAKRAYSIKPRQGSNERERGRIGNGGRARALPPGHRDRRAYQPKLRENIGTRMFI